MSNLLIGVISDTHGLIRTEALEAFKGVDIIFHGGDIGNTQVLRALDRIAPVIAVRGNCDRNDWSKEIPASQTFEMGGRRFLIIHNLQELKNHPSPVDAIIYGHSHKTNISINDRILYLNPGSAGPQRFRLPVTVARIRNDDGILMPEIIELVTNKIKPD